MSWLDQEIYRIYRCSECSAEIGINQLAKDDWITECPICGKESMLIKSGQSKGVSLCSDTKTPKTLGMLAEKNRDNKEKRGEDTSGFVKTKRPKYNFDILKNPKRYIETGKI